MTVPNPSQVVVSTTAATKKGLAVMGAADASGNPQAGGFVIYRLGGDCVEEPATTGWEATDTFKVNVTFSFSPVKYDTKTGAEAGTITPTPNTATITDDGSDSVTIAYKAPTGVTLSSDAKYLWSIKPGTGVSIAIEEGQGTATAKFTADDELPDTDPGTAEVSLVIVDGLNKYVPASVTLTVESAS